MTPLARDDPKLRSELWRLTWIPGKALDFGGFAPVALSRCHVAFPSYRNSRCCARRSEDCFITASWDGGPSGTVTMTCWPERGSRMVRVMAASWDGSQSVLASRPQGRLVLRAVANMPYGCHRIVTDA